MTTKTATTATNNTNTANTATQLLNDYNTATQLLNDLQATAKTATGKTATKTVERIERIKSKIAMLEKMLTQNGVIMPFNVLENSEHIAIKALQNCLSNGGKGTAGGNFNFLYFLYVGLIKDVTTTKNTAKGITPFSDGYDIVMLACETLLPYVGQTLTAKANGDKLDKKGNPVTILKATFNACYRHIMNERNRLCKKAYVDENDENGNRLYYEIPKFWDIPTITDYKGIIDLIDKMNLTPRQNEILGLRLRGLSLHQISKKLQVSRTAIQKTVKQIQTKAENIGLKIK
jgi:DNA-binding NarL/FixJ family response regulator